MTQSILVSAAIGLLLAGCCHTIQPGPASDVVATPGHAGSFDADIATVNLLADGRNALLLKSLTYTDVRSVKWIAPAGTQSDGASIPQVFWSIVGGPWEGKYRFAALIHDHYCDSHDGRRWQDVHRMFYEASLAGGTDPLLAKIIYAAVYHFGPRWADQSTGQSTDQSRGYEQLGLLIPPEQRRIAELNESQALNSLPSASALSITPIPRKLGQHEQALLVLSAPQGPRIFAASQVSAAVAKWDRIREYLAAHQDASLGEIDSIQ